jgi:hypothetical protein
MWIMSLEDNPYAERAEEGLRIRGGAEADPRTNALLAVANELNKVWRTIRELNEQPLRKQFREQTEFPEEGDEV